MLKKQCLVIIHYKRKLNLLGRDDTRQAESLTFNMVPKLEQVFKVKKIDSNECYIVFVGIFSFFFSSFSISFNLTLHSTWWADYSNNVVRDLFKNMSKHIFENLPIPANHERKSLKILENPLEHIRDWFSMQ